MRNVSLFHFCNVLMMKQEQPTQPKETPQVVKDVVEVLEETVPQASDLLKF